MSTNAVWQDPNPPSTDRKPPTVALTIAGVFLTLVVLTSLVLVVTLTRADAVEQPTADETLVLLAAGVEDPEAFTPSAAAPGPSASTGYATGASELAQQLSFSADRGVRLASGVEPGVYGAVGEANSCDVAAVANYLDAEPEVARAWAGVIGIAPDDIPFYLNTLTSVYLRSDTWVTAHHYRADEAAAFQAVLQMESAVLVDPVGVPRVHCATGAPLLPPADENLAEFAFVDGAPWEGYHSQNAVAIRYSNDQGATQPVTEFVVFDLAASELVPRRVGGTIALGDVVVELPDPVAMNVPPTKPVG